MENIRNCGGQMSIFTNTCAHFALIFISLGAINVYPRLAFKQPQTYLALFSTINNLEIQASIEKIKKNESTIVNTLTHELDQKHDQLLAALIESFPLPDNAWKNCLEEFNKTKSQDNLLITTVSHLNVDQIEAIEALLYSYNINPERITIIPTESTSYFVSAGQGIDDTHQVIHELRINFEKLSKKPVEIQEAIIKHELQHLLQYDSLEFSFITSLLQEYGISIAELFKHPAFIAYKRHIEYRADLKAAAEDIAIANAFKKDFEDYIQQQPENAEKQFSSHPSKKDRHQAMSNLISYLEAENRLKSEETLPA